MAEKAKSVGLPETEEQKDFRYFMKAGLHVAKVREIVQLVDKDGKLQNDKNGNPGIKIIFYTRDKNEKGESVEPEAEAAYYYSPLPIDDPDRKNPDKMCKSEFKLTKLKQAMGFGLKAISAADAKKAKIWIAIKRQDIVDQEGNPVYKDGKAISYHVVEDVFPYDANSPDTKFGRPVLMGDPITDAANFLTGYFYEKKQKTVSGSTSSKPASSASAGSETPISEGEVSAAPTQGDDW